MRMKWRDVKTRPLATTIQQPRTVRRAITTVLPWMHQRTACNYDETSTQDDGSCVFADDACEECAEDGTVLLFDVDGDGVCDQDETEGCLNPFACNYNEYARTTTARVSF